jgi:hypothetical protein
MYFRNLYTFLDFLTQKKENVVVGCFSARGHMVLARPNSHYGSASPSWGRGVGTPTGGHRAQHRWGGTTGGGSLVDGGGSGGGENRRGPMGTRWAKQVVAWLTEELRHRWGGEALGRRHSSQWRRSGGRRSIPGVPAAQGRWGGGEGQAPSMKKGSVVQLTKTRWWRR